MENQKDKLATLSPQQSNPYTAQATDFQIGRADEFSDDYVPGHGQCGASEKEYDQLLAESAKAGGKPRPGSPRSRATEVSDAGKPRTRGIDGAEGM